MTEPEPRVVLSQIATSVRDRARLRANSKYRKGYALNPNSQYRKHKQRRPEVRD